MQKAGLSTDKQSHQKRILYRFDAAKIVCYEDEPIGLLKAYCDASGWNIVQIQVSPEYQGKGIGSAIVERVLEQAANDGLNVSLHVFKENPAKKLYGRLGFITVSEGDVEYTMCCEPGNRMQRING